MHSIRLSSPAAHLREYIRIYGQREVRTDGATIMHSVPARAFPLLEFVFGDPFQVMYPHQSLLEASPHAVVVGPQTHCRCRLQFQGTVECFVILFQPTGLHRLFSIPVQELTDHAYEGHSVLGTFVSGLECRLAESKDFRERVGIADQFISG
jgi:hypothetical protein